MKTNKIIAGMTLTWVLLSISSAGVFADQSKEKISEKREMITEKKSMLKASDNASFKRISWENQKIWGNLNDKNLDQIDEEIKEEVSELVSEFQKNTKQLMDEYKEDFDEIKKDYKENYQELKKEFDSQKEDSVQKEIREEMETLKDQFETALQQVKQELDTKKSKIYSEYKSDLWDLLGKDSTYIENLESAEKAKKKMQEAIAQKQSQMEAKREEMKERMQEAKEKRKEFRANAKQKISSYKNAYANKIEDKLAKISQEQLQKFNVQLEELFTKVESSETMSNDNKEMMLSRITALQDLITDVLSESEINLDELLKMEL